MSSWQEMGVCIRVFEETPILLRGKRRVLTISWKPSLAGEGITARKSIKSRFAAFYTISEGLFSDLVWEKIQIWVSTHSPEDCNAQR